MTPTSTATLAPNQITQPGVYDIPADQYHADPVAGGSLSASGARLLLPPNCPARYRYDRDHPTTASKAQEDGTAAHTVLLGTGPQPIRVDAELWNTKAVKEQVAEIRAAGNIPLKPAAFQTIHDMADELLNHPVAGPLFTSGRGHPEQTLIWRSGNVWRRARLDWLPDHTPGQRMLIADYKTARTASPDDLDRVINDYAYHLQGSWYLDGVRTLKLAGKDELAYLLVVQEKTPPYLVTVVQLTVTALRIGDYLAREALDLYQQCTETGQWPGYSSDVEVIGLPMWVERQYEELI